jgi:hypothetical protein
MPPKTTSTSRHQTTWTDKTTAKEKALLEAILVHNPYLFKGPQLKAAWSGVAATVAHTFSSEEKKPDFRNVRLRFTRMKQDFCVREAVSSASSGQREAVLPNDELLRVVCNLFDAEIKSNVAKKEASESGRKNLIEAAMTSKAQRDALQQMAQKKYDSLKNPVDSSSENGFNDDKTDFDEGMSCA